MKVYSLRNLILLITIMKSMSEGVNDDASIDLFKIFMCLCSMICKSHILYREDKNSVVRCQNIVRGIKNTIKKRRKKCPKSAVSSAPIQPRRMTITTTDKFKSNVDDNLRNFLRQFLKKSLFMADLQLKPYRTGKIQFNQFKFKIKKKIY
jgi:hypothetical protein